MLKDARIISPLAPRPSQKDVVEAKDTPVFKNDLTEEDKNEVLAKHLEGLRKLLGEETLTVNTVARILNIQHALASKLCKACNSARATLLNWSSSTAQVRRAKSVLGKLSPEERAELLKQLH